MAEPALPKVADLCADFGRTLCLRLFFEPLRANLKSRLKQGPVQRQVEDFADAAAESLAKFFESKETPPEIVEMILGDFHAVLAIRTRESFPNPAALPDAVMNEWLENHPIPGEVGEPSTYRLAFASVLRPLILAAPLFAEWERAGLPRVFEPLENLRKKLYEWLEPSGETASQRGSTIDQRFEHRYRTELLQRAFRVDLGALRIGTSQAVDVRDLFVSPELTIRPSRNRESAMKSAKRAAVSSDGGSPLSLAAARELLGRSGASGEERGTDRIPAVEVLLSYPRVVLVGLPGSGKSTLLEWLQVQLADARIACPGKAERAAPVPVLLRVRQLNQTEPPKPAEFVARCMHSGDWAADMPPGWIERQLAANNLFLMVDGLDETDADARSTKILPWLADLIKKYPNNRYLVTSRPVGYPPGWLTDLEFTECDLADFSPAQALLYAQHWNIARLLAERKSREEAERDGRIAGSSMFDSFKEHSHIRDLARTPLMLAAICLVNRYEGGKLPDDRPILYRLCVEGLLHNWDQRRGITTEFSLEEKLRVCREIALKMQLAAVAELSVAEVREVFDREIGDRTRASRLLESIRQRAGVLIERRTNVFAFAHLTFQEYLAAVAIHQGSEGAPSPAALVEQCADGRWREVIPLYSGVTTRTNAKRFLEALLNQPQSEALPYLLCESWGACLRELGRDGALFDAVARCVLTSPHIFGRDSIRTTVFDQIRFAQLANETIGSAPNNISLAYRWLATNPSSIDWPTIRQRFRKVRSHQNSFGMADIIHLVYSHAAPGDTQLWRTVEPALAEPGPRFSETEFYAIQAEVAFSGVSNRARRSIQSRSVEKVVEDLPIERLKPIITALMPAENLRDNIWFQSKGFAWAAAHSATPPDRDFLMQIKALLCKGINGAEPRQQDRGPETTVPKRYIDEANSAIKYLDEQLAAISLHAASSSAGKSARKRKPTRRAVGTAIKNEKTAQKRPRPRGKES